MQIACVLKSGPEYRAEHLYALADSIVAHNPGIPIRCLTDINVNHPAVEVMPLHHGWPGWWSKIELFRPGNFEGPTLYMDIDTVVVDRIDDLQIDGFTMLADVYRAGDFGSGLMGWMNPPTHVYEAFCRSPDVFMRRYRTRDKLGDQAFIRDFLGERPRVFDKRFRSYKVHCRKKVPHGTQIVYFHGRPRPWNVQLCL